MILTLGEITTIIKENPGAKKLQQGRAYLAKMRRHIYGEGLEDYLKGEKTLDIYEKQTARDVRAKYGKSNKDLYSRLSRPMDKVFTAKGGSLYYNLGEAQTKKAIQLSSDIGGGISVRKWVETFWKPHMLDDPFGVTFMEILPETQVALAIQEGRSFVYPTYKPVSSIYDFKSTGNKLEWIVFQLDHAQKVEAGIDPQLLAFRVVDDAFDYYVTRDQDEVKVVNNSTLPNYFGQVPGMVNSDIFDPANEDYFLSFYDDILELAEQFLRKGSIKITHDFLHGFPKYSEFASNCAVCRGSGVYDGASCAACGGTGKSWISDVSKTKLLSMPSSKEDAVILPKEVGAYISPDKTFYEIATDDLQLLEDLMTHTLWGTQSETKTSGMSLQQETRKTATEVMGDIQPRVDRLFVISEMSEKRHKFILDMIIRVQVQASYKGASVNYGRRYLLESADVLLKRYSEARAAGNPVTLLDTMLNEFYEANYQSDPIGLEVARKLMYVEPLVHITADKMVEMMIDDEDYKAKLFFSEWLSQTEEAELIVQDIPTLRDSLYAYTSKKKIKQPPEPKTAIAA
jgi:hypothetical protein